MSIQKKPSSMDMTGQIIAVLLITHGKHLAGPEHSSIRQVPTKPSIMKKNIQHAVIEKNLGSSRSC